MAALSSEGLEVAGPLPTASLEGFGSGGCPHEMTESPVCSGSMKCELVTAAGWSADAAPAKQLRGEASGNAESL